MPLYFIQTCAILVACMMRDCWVVVSSWLCRAKLIGPRFSMTKADLILAGHAIKFVDQVKYSSMHNIPDAA